MTKKTLQKTTKKSTSKLASSTNQFGRWLLPAILTITFYIVSLLIAAIYVKSETSIASDVSLIASILFTLALVSAAWWLIECARWTMILIERKPLVKSKKK